MDLEKHLQRQYDWSLSTFGPGPRSAGVIKHIEKELYEVAENPDDVEEWIDVVILALDGAMRQGYTPKEVAKALEAKQAKNETRKWPDWREFTEGEAIEHIK